MSLARQVGTAVGSRPRLATSADALLAEGGPAGHRRLRPGAPYATEIRSRLGRRVQGTVMPAMQAVRDVADQLEKIVPDDLWPLPKYAEILFIK